MTVQSDKKEKVYFESATLFKELVEANQLKNLKSVKSNPYPTYCFRASEKVTDVIGAFVVKHNMKCDRTVDESWEDFEKIVIQAEGKPETVVTRNIRAVKRIVSEGYGNMLKRTCVDQYGKKTFVFYANERITAIKAEEDEKSKVRFEKKLESANMASSLNMEMNKNKINTQMSQLIKKAMEG